MFSSPEMTHDLTCHAQGWANNGMLSHPRDSPSWKLVDRTWKEFRGEKRNLRLALSIDGINSHKSLSSKSKPGNNIDVYLAQLIADLKLLWETGTNDGLRARQDLEAMGINPELQTQPRGNGLKSNDCHVLMQQLLPFAINGVLHVKVRKTIIVREVKLCGPVHFRCMYPFERYMKTLKGYVRNHHRPEGCIAKCYVAEEALEFCSDYLKNMKSIGNPHERADERIRTGKPLSRGTVEVVDAKLLDEAHLYVLRNTADVEPYIEQHMLELKDHNPRASQNSKWLQTQHSRTFISWLKTKVDTHLANGEDICESIRWLAKGPSFTVKKYSGFVINEYRLHTTSRDESRTPQCSGVSLVAHAIQIASAKDSNPVYGTVTYYSCIQEIWDIDYRIFTVLLGTMESDQSSSHDEDSKQRGPTIKGKTTKGKVIVTYNKKGVPITVEATKLASFEGMVARSMVPITYATWRDVEQEKKEDLWQYILIDDWKVFVSQILSKKWEEISQKAKKMRGQHRYNHRLSRKGYVGLTFEIMQETGKEEDEIDRALLWKKARQMKKGGYDPNVQIVVDKMTVKNYLDGEKKKIEKRFNQIEGAIEKLKKGMNHASEGASYQGWDKVDFEDNPPEELLVSENIEVMMEMSVQRDVLLPFPLDDEFIYKVKDAVGKKEKEKGEGTLKREKKKEKEEGTPQRRRTRAQMRTMPRFESNRVLKVCARMVDIQLKNVESVKVQYEDDMFGYESFTYITWEDFEVVFTVDEMIGSAITCYMMYLFEEIKNEPKRDHGICFVSPSAISPSGRKAKFKNSDEAIRSVADRLSLRKDNDIVLVPYNPEFAMKLYTAQSGTNKKSGGTECGYYVCKFMKKIVENGLEVLVNKNVGDGKEEYMDDDIDDISKE
ncbi:hypothetical protein F3Y22_tig00116939pilonHSYRG00277 [Hibiscus syriacus]|uniref:DUF4218 domain-containing protein n=1 Tax=Hibiscus syriacus TaxID=106335 RepID=A0A6A2WM67_HIBSY|nr:hypothetical protein F3Y22_tig00116939pilonHSYRG00277 [Hibiscus syriacus]